MKAFLRDVLLFLLPIFIVAPLADRFLSASLERSRNLDLGVWNDVLGGRVDADLVVYGASKAWVQVDTGMMAQALGQSTYNLGVDGSNFWLQYLRHLELMRHDHKPKVIVHVVDTFSLEKKRELYNLEQFLPYLRSDDLIREYTSSYDGYNVFDYYVPLVRYYGRRRPIVSALMLWARPQRVPADRIRGYQPQDKVWNGDLDAVRAEMKSYSAKLDQASVQLFDKYLDQCKRDGIAVALVIPPEYIEGQQFVSNRDDVVALYREQARKYAIPLLDYSKDPLSYEKAYFYNAMHLNRRGAELFTKKLISDLSSSIPELRPTGSAAGAPQ